MMNNVFEALYDYGFHDTEITMISGKGLEIILYFEKGAYILDKNGKETVLSKPFSLILKIDSRFADSFENVLEIIEYRKRIRHIKYCDLKKYNNKETFKISLLYFGFFNNGLLFEGGFCAKKITLLIEGIESIKMCDI